MMGFISSFLSSLFPNRKKRYAFDELSPFVQSDLVHHNKDWYTNQDGWWKDVVKNAVNAAHLLGIREVVISYYPPKRMLTVVGDYSYRKGSCSHIKKCFPSCETLKQIASRLMEGQRRRFYGVSVRVSHKIVDGNVEGYVGRENIADIESALLDFSKWVVESIEDERQVLTSREVIEDVLMGHVFTKKGFFLS